MSYDRLGGERRAPASEPDWLTLGQAAKFLGVAQSTIRKWSDQGRVPAFYTPGGHAGIAAATSRRSSTARARRARKPARSSSSSTTTRGCASSSASI